MGISYIVGGAGDCSQAGSGAGMAYDDAVTTWSAAQGANGGPLVTVGAATCSNNGGSVKITSAGDFGAAVVGVFAYVDFVDTYIDDYYQITAADSDSITLDLTYTADGSGTNNVTVGGAENNEGLGIQAAFDAVDAVGPQTIRIRNTTYAVTATIDIDTNSGNASYPVVVMGVDSNGDELSVGDTLPQLVAGADLANGLIELSNGIDYWDIRWLDFNCEDSGNTAEYGLYCNDSNCRNHIIQGCVARNAGNTGIYTKWIYGSMLNCECYGAVTGYGAVYNCYHSKAIGGSYHDNHLAGIYFNCPNGALVSNVAYDNGNEGFVIEASSDYAYIANNTSEGNATDGYFIDADAEGMVVVNNSAVNNGAFGYDIDSDEYRLWYFAYNHSHNNTSGHISEIGTWTVAFNGHNITGDPLFASVADGTEDYTPGHGSPLLAAGFPPRFPRDGDQDAVTNYPHIGAVTRKEPKTSLVGGM